MKIAFFTSELAHKMGKKMGGLGNVALEMLGYFSTRDDIEMYVFSASSQESDKVIKVTEKNITYHWFSDSMIRTNEKHNFNQYISELNTLMIRYVEDEYLLSDKFAFDIIHCHDWMMIRIILRFCNS